MGTFNNVRKRVWNLFSNRDPTPYEDSYSNSRTYYQETSSSRIDRPKFGREKSKSISAAIYARLALDAARIPIRHVQLDENGRYIKDVDSNLNSCFNLEANLDQNALDFKYDMYASMIDEGVIAVVPIDTEGDFRFEEFDVCTMRTAKILRWKPNEIEIWVYNNFTGRHEKKWVPKKSVAILENPLYSIINDKNSTMQRLIRKLNLLDAIDEQSGSGKLDMVIQLPYSLKTEFKRMEAQKRKAELEDQLVNSKYGIGYIDATEHITQLNRPVDNNLMKQIEYLQNLLFSQLGLTQSILDGTADENTMTNYNKRTTELFVSVATLEFKRKFISTKARKARESVEYFTNPFTLMSASSLAESADKLTRNEILTKNEIRQMIGFKPSDDPKADMLINSNISQSSDALKEMNNKEGEKQNGSES